MIAGHTPGKPEVQPEAMRLAAANEDCAKAWVDGSAPNIFRMETACELRRLHEVNKELLAALTKIERLFSEKCSASCMTYADLQAIEESRAAIAKATGATT